MPDLSFPASRPPLTAHALPSRLNYQYNRWKEYFLLPGVIRASSAGGTLWMLDAASKAGQEAAVGIPHLSSQTGTLQEPEQNSSPVVPISPVPGSYLSDLELVRTVQGPSQRKYLAELRVTCIV